MKRLLAFLFIFHLLTVPEFTARVTESAPGTPEVAEASAFSLFGSIYEGLQGSKPPMDVFMKCMQGLSKLREQVETDWNSRLITIIDFRLSSNKKRLWVIDLKENKVIFNTLVAHGRNSGEEFANDFSNRPSSYQSSIGFYLTGDTYQGKHGLSLYLDGLEDGFNDKARERAIVMHGADYVSQDFIAKNGRLGRSLGCPSVPVRLHRELIDTIKGKTCLFIYYPDREYETSSPLLNGDMRSAGL